MAKEGFLKSVSKMEKKLDNPKYYRVIMLFAFAIYLLGLIVYLQSVKWQMGTEVIALFAIAAMAVSMFLDKKTGALVFGCGLAALAVSHVVTVFSSPVSWAGGVLGSSIVLIIAIVLAVLLLAAAVYYFCKGQIIGFLPKLIVCAAGFLTTLLTLIFSSARLFAGHEDWAYDSVEHANTILIYFAAAAMLLVWIATAFFLPFRKEEKEAA